jgi:alkylation response protein AidB-like acyl-CoA dehydrogenase
MFLALNEYETAIADATADTIEAEAPLSRWWVPQTDAKADEDRLLTFGAGMGWNGFSAPASAGGAEASVIEEMLVFRALGRNLAPVGFTAATIGAQVALQAGKADLAADIVAGKVRVALAGSSNSLRLLGAGGANLALCLEGDRFSLKQMAADHPTVIGLDAMTTVGDLPADAPEVASAEDATLVLRFRLLVAAQLQAIAETALTESNAYAKTREQFGKPIGSFQAVRHKIADMEVRARLAEAQIYFAAVRLCEGGADMALQVNSALALSVAAARENSETNIANHGAIGVTTENSGHLLLKRAVLWNQAIPSYNALLDLVAEADAPAL